MGRVGAARTAGPALQAAGRALAPVSETPSLDAQVLLADTLGLERSRLLAHPEHPLTADEAARFEGRLARCVDGEPLPYVLGWWEFCGRRFAVGRAALIPRPETELLVEAACAGLRAAPGRPRALELGTGSGCVAVALALEVPAARLTAVDLSAEALRLARRNAVHHGVLDRVDLVQADLAGPLRGTFDLLCANLPYIASAELEGLAAARREPRLALDGGPDGLAVIRRMLRQAPSRLAAGGLVLCEIGAGQGPAALQAARAAFPQAGWSVQSDLAGRDRLLIGVSGRP